MENYQYDSFKSSSKDSKFYSGSQDSLSIIKNRLPNVLFTGKNFRTLKKRYLRLYYK